MGTHALEKPRHDAPSLAGRDVVVIGFHSAEDAENCAELVDKTGKLTLSYTSKLPPDAVIEQVPQP